MQKQGEEWLIWVSKEAYHPLVSRFSKRRLRIMTTTIGVANIHIIIIEKKGRKALLTTTVLPTLTYHQVPPSHQLGRANTLSCPNGAVAAKKDHGQEAFPS